MKNKKIAFALLLITGGLVVMYYHFNPASSFSFFPSCPTKTIFGIYCPGCGTQRAFHYILHRDLSAAFRYNPLFVIFIPLIITLIIQYFTPIFTNKRLSIPFIESRAFILSLFFIVVGYFIIRNLPFELFEVLRPPPYEISYKD